MISSGLMIFFLLFKLLLDCELVLLWEIRKSINLESANFKLDPELSPLNDHTLIPCRTIMNFSLHSEIWQVWRKWRRVWEWERKRRKRNGNVNHHTMEQPSKKRKEGLPESKSEVKKPSPEKKKVCKPFDHHPLLFQNLSVLLMLKHATLILELIGSGMIACVWYVSLSTWIRYLKMKK